MLSFLNKPYPCDHSLSSGLKNALGVSFFLIVFFFIFQPFGIGNIAMKDRIIVILLYGLVNFVATLSILYLLKFVFPKFYDDEQWVVWKEIISFLFLFLAIDAGCLIVNTLYFNDPFGFPDFFLQFIYVLAFGSLPVGFSILMKYNRQLRKNLEEAKHINSAINSKEENSEVVKVITIKLQSDNKNESLELSPTSFYAAESAANYVTVSHLMEGQIKKSLLRTTMKNMISDIGEVNHITRCHRSFIVNLNHIESIQGDSRGYEITLKNDAGIIPVSRSYIPTIKSYLNIN